MLDQGVGLHGIDVGAETPLRAADARPVAHLIQPTRCQLEAGAARGIAPAGRRGAALHVASLRARDERHADARPRRVQLAQRRQTRRREGAASCDVRSIAAVCGGGDARCARAASARRKRSPRDGGGRWGSGTGSGGETERLVDAPRLPCSQVLARTTLTRRAVASPAAAQRRLRRARTVSAISRRLGPGQGRTVDLPPSPSAARPRLALPVAASRCRHSRHSRHHRHHRRLRPG